MVDSMDTEQMDPEQMDPENQDVPPTIRADDSPWLRPKGILSFVDAVHTILKISSFFRRRDINPNYVYSTAEVAKILSIDRVEVIRLIIADKIDAKMPNNDYKIIGRAIIQYLQADRKQSKPAVPDAPKVPDGRTVKDDRFLRAN